MVSRRDALRAGGAALLAVVAGCASGADASPETTEPTSVGTTADSTSLGERVLAGEAVPASNVPDGSPVAVASPALHELVADAASADGRVDLLASREVEPETLALGQFEYLEFRGETYEPTATFTGFAGEATYDYSLVSANDNAGDGEVLDYESLNDSERAIADEMLENGSYDVGPHEERRDAARTFEPQSHLRVDGETYRIRVAVGDYGRHHMLRLDTADPDEDAQVVTVRTARPTRAG
ncbi:hypothetical protein [Halobacterium noricense]|uniref:hypothetical protein n=1 Tax=Halobacterium noricense TaxID=223182 RepID=UPI001E5D9F4D|nr:hypothetical protein [Halobacterium noricense]UHH25402.1 hypothetical protein LT974_00295 [Halobacterium noricense]